MKVRVVLADHDREFLSQLIAIVGTEVQIVATAIDGTSALEYIRTLRPDVAIVDLQMPELNGIEIARMAKSCPTHPAVVICSVESDPEIIEHALNAGALGYVLKARIATDLVPALTSVAAGHQFVSHM